MRQLLEQGWMHNRVRMAVASYLTKNLLIDWREGEAHFMEHLLDGDESQNNGNWQWAASTGADPQPYFRVFNPVLQQEKFGPDGVYVRRWVPELERTARTSTWPSRGRPPRRSRSEAGCVIGSDYPEPLVDLKESRREAIAHFERAARLNPCTPGIAGAYLRVAVSTSATEPATMAATGTFRSRCPRWASR